MSEEIEEIEEIEETKGKGSNMKVFIVIGVLFLLSNAVWGGLFFVKGNGEAEAAEKADAAKDAAEATIAEQEAQARSLNIPGPIVALEPFVVNLDEPAGAHYLRVTVKVEIDREENRPHIDERMVMLRDRFITILSSKRMAQLRTQEDKKKLREELLAVAQDLTGERAVRAVYFTEFLTQ